MASILQITPLQTCLCLWMVLIMYPYICYSSTRVSETNLDNSGKQKIWHAAIVAVFWDNCSKILRPNISEKLNGEYFEKINIKTVITYGNISIYQISINLENFRLWDQIWPKETMIKILRNKHWIHNQHITSKSCSKFHLENNQFWG